MAILRILAAKDLESTLRMGEVIEVVGEAYRLYSSGEAGVFPILATERALDRTGREKLGANVET